MVKKKIFRGGIRSTGIDADRISCGVRKYGNRFTVSGPCS